MKKEVLIAIIVGFTLGLIITFGVYRAQKSLEQKAAKDEIVENQQLPGANNTQVLLSITQPEDGEISDKDAIVVGGITQKNSLVTILSSFDDQAIQADEFGNFSTEFSLDTGPNQITITSFNQDGTKQEKIINVVYTTYDFEEESEE